MNESFLFQLQELLKQRRSSNDPKSYTADLLQQGLDKCLQKVGEEAVEYILDSMNQNRQRTIEEGADLLFHFLLSLVKQNIDLQEIIDELKKRQK